MTIYDPQSPMISHDIYCQDYRSKQRQEWYSAVANTYRWARPPYPTDLMNRVLAEADLNALDSVLEIGCGPGIATVDLAKRGLAVTAVEPSKEACKVTRNRCQKFSSVKVVHSTFEDVDLSQEIPRSGFDAVVAATSFHWLSPEIACPKISRYLRSEGTLIILWSTPPQPTDELFSLLQPTYESHNLGSLGAEQARTSAYYQDQFERFALILNDSGYFKPSKVEIETYHSAYSIDRYLALLSTLSGYIALEVARRQGLLDDIGRILRDKMGTHMLQTTRWVASQVAFKR